MLAGGLVSVVQYAPARLQGKNGKPLPKPPQPLLSAGGVGLVSQLSVLSVVDAEGDEVQAPIDVTVTPSAGSCNADPLQYIPATNEGFHLVLDTASEAYGALPNSGTYSGVWDAALCRLRLTWRTSGGSAFTLLARDAATLLAAVSAQFYSASSNSEKEIKADVDMAVAFTLTDFLVSRTVQANDVNSTRTTGPRPALIQYRLVRSSGGEQMNMTAPRAYPSVHPSLRITEGDAPVAILPDILIRSQSNSVQKFQVVLAVGCGAGDGLHLPADARAAFVASVTLGSDSRVPPGGVTVTGCPLKLDFLLGVNGAAPAAVATLLSRVQLVVGPANQRQEADGVMHEGYRVVFFTATSGGAEASVLATVAVTPANDALLPPANPVVYVDEGADPVLELTIAQNCSDPNVRASMALSGGACFEDPDPAMGWSALEDDGGLTLPLVQLSNYTVTATTSGSVPADATVFSVLQEVRSTVLNCSASARTSAVGQRAPRLSAGHALTPCSRIWLKLAAAPFNFENPARAQNVSVGLQFSDTYAQTTRSTSSTLTVQVRDVDDAAVLT